jgi:hypothetical protein
MQGPTRSGEPQVTLTGHRRRFEHVIGERRCQVRPHPPKGRGGREEVWFTGSRDLTRRSGIR